MPGEEWEALIKVDAANLYAGVWDSTKIIEFDFFAEDYSPVALQVRWQSTTNENFWAYDLTPGLTNTWTSYTASFGNWESWKYAGADAAQYASDLTDVDWIGIYIFRNTANAQDYGVDDFALVQPIPEPSQIIMLLSSLISTVLAYRHKKTAA